MRRTCRFAPFAFLAFLLSPNPTALAVQPPLPVPDLAAKAMMHPALVFETSSLRADDVAGAAGLAARGRLERLAVTPEHAVVDLRGGRWTTLILSEPIAAAGAQGAEAAVGEAAWQGLLEYLEAHRAAFGVDPAELEPRISVLEGGARVHVAAARSFEGIPVRGAHVVAVILHGRLMLLGTERWGDVEVATVPTLGASAAAARLDAYVAPAAARGYREAAWLAILPTVEGDAARYGHRLAWILEPTFGTEVVERWQAAVDAHSGEVLFFEDTTHYMNRTVSGGVFPLSNDGLAPGGTEVAGYPMPFLDVTHGGGTATTDTGGNVAGITGTMTTALTGPYLVINDICGAVNEASSGDLDLGISGGTDCTTPPGGSAGNTHSARTAWYEVNRIAEMARGHMPANPWLNGSFTARVNFMFTCGASWGGGVITTGRLGACANTGELAAVLDHEWGHGMDSNGTAVGVSNPGEGIADVYAALRLNTSCIGRGFRPTFNCTGYGDPCLDCTGVRDIDWMRRASQMPHDRAWASANCGGGVHCRGYLYSEAIWDLMKRDLPSLYGMSDDTAREITTRLTYLGADLVGTWFVSNLAQEGGCDANGGYLQFLAADDDNTNLADGTPHMRAIRAAFERHDIHCSTPAVLDGGCAGRPTTAPVVTGVGVTNGAQLGWAPVAGATRYKVYRTEGELACGFGKTLIGTTTGTTFSDSGLQNGRHYSYVVAAFTASDSCMGPASACTTVIPGISPLHSDGFEAGDTSGWTEEGF